MKQSRSKKDVAFVKDKIATNVAVVGILALCGSVLYLASPLETSADEIKSGTAQDIYVWGNSSESVNEVDTNSSTDSGVVEFEKPEIIYEDSSLVEFSEDDALSEADSYETIGFIEEEESTSVSESYEISEGCVLDVPNWDFECDSNRKLYMDYTAVTDTASAQYDLLYNNAYTTPEGLRAVGDRYCIALGSYYTTTIGQKVDLILADGSVVHCILGDCKADIHTNATNQYNWGTGNVAEFIIDGSVFNWQCDGSGTVNWINGLDGEIGSIVLVD